MRNLAHKVTGDSLTADEFNDIPEEEENLVTSTGQTLTASDLYQIAKAVATYVAIGDFYVDSGSGNNYILSAVSPLQAPISYSTGFRVRFVISHTNTSAATININSLGIKNIKSYNNQTLTGGELIIGKIVELYFDGTNFLLMNDILLQTKSFIDGLTLSNNIGNPNTHIDFAIGSCTNSTKHVILNNNAAFTKRLDTVWAAGTGNGGRATAATYSANTWYHAFIIGKPDGTIDFGFDTSLTAVNLLTDATGYIYYRRLTSIYNDVSSHIQPFYMCNFAGVMKVLWKTWILDHNVTNATNDTDLLYALTVPSNISVFADYSIKTVAETSGTPSKYIHIVITSPLVDAVLVDSASYDVNPLMIDAVSGHGSSLYESILTNTSAQIRLRCNHSSTEANFKIFTIGWQELN